MQISLALNLSGGAGEGSGASWVVRAADGTPAVFAADFALSRYYYNGNLYGSQASFLAASTGVVASGIYTFGPYQDPLGTNFITNSTFPNTTGWTGINGSALAAVTDGGAPALEATAPGGVNSGAYFAIANVPGRAFLFSAQVRRGTQPSGVVLSASASSATLNGINATINSTTSYASRSLYAGAANSGLNVGMRVAGTNAGTEYLKTPSAIEVWPFQNFPQNAFSVVIEATTAATAAGNQVVWQADAETSRDRVRVVWDASGNLRVIVTSENNEFANLDMGVVAGSTPFKLAFAVTQSDFAASLNGYAVVDDFVGNLSGMVQMRINTSFTGEDWLGTTQSVSVVAGRQSDPWLQNASAPTNAIATAGDSYMIGGPSIPVPTAQLAVLLGRPTITTAVGGTTIYECRDRMMAAPYLNNYTQIGCDGGPAGYISVNDYLNCCDEIFAFIGHNRIIWMGPVACGPSSSPTPNTLSLAMKAISDGLATRDIYALSIFDILAAHGDGSPQDNQDILALMIPTSFVTIDGGHITQAGWDLIEAQIQIIVDDNDL